MFRENGCKIYGSYETKRKWYVSETNKADKDKWGHPTIKPLNIIKNIIENSSQKGDIVLDCFMGSGTTGIACKQLGRDFIGCEINPTYFKVAQERIGATEYQPKAEQMVMEL